VLLKFLFSYVSFSLTVKEQFAGSEANLRRFFDQKSSKFSRILAIESHDENSGNCDPTELAILYLLILSKELLFEESTKQLPQVSSCCYLILNDSHLSSYKAECFQMLEVEISFKYD
jgi:hypothetical protein